MKAIPSNITRSLPRGARIKVADNSGAKEIEVINVKTIKTVKARNTAAGIGDIVIGVVKAGPPDVKHTLVQAVVIRTKKPIIRFNGLRVKFEDNACLLLKPKEIEPKGSLVKGPVPREIIMRYPALGKVTRMVV